MDTFKSKRDALLAFLDKGMTMVHLDARKEGVVVPRHFVGQQDLRLNLSYRFGGAQMEISDESVEATLTFGGAPFRVIIPFSAMYALTSHVTGAGLVFPESLPEDILAALRKEIDLDGSQPQAEVAMKAAAPAVSDSEGRPTKAPHLRVIQGDKK